MTRDTEGSEDLIQQLGIEVRMTQAAVDDFDEAVAGYLGVNRTDLRCLEVLLQELPVATPGKLSTALGLTTGSVTAMLDRLERLGYLTRSPDPADRRKVVVQATPEVGRKAGEIYGPLAMAGAAGLSQYSPDQLRLLIDFHQRSRRLQEEHMARVRAMPAARRAPRTRSE